MPRGDRTGPWGMGPLTGRRMGFCAGYSAPGFTFSGPGYGMGRGMGAGRGFGRGLGYGRGRGFMRGGYGGFWEYPLQSFMQEDEVTYLENQAQAIKEELSQIKTRLDELKKTKEKSGEK